MTDNRFSDDEFDVEVFFEKLYRVGGKAMRKILFPFRLLFAKPLVLLAFLAGGAALAGVIRLSVPPTYYSSFLIKPSNRGDLYFLHLLYGLQVLVKDKDTDKLVTELGIDEATAKNLTRLDYTPIRPGNNRDSAEAIEVNIYTKDINSFETVQTRVLAYIENSPYYVKVKEARAYELKMLEEKLRKDIAEIDSMKLLLAANIQPRGSGGFVYGEPLDPVKMYEEGFSLFRQQVGLNWQKQFLDNFELVKPCIVTKRPYFPRFMVLLPYALGLGALLCMVYNYRRL